MRSNRTGARATVAALLGGALALTGFVLIPPTTAAAATPCPAGVPVTGDYNGDGSTDLAVSVIDNVAGAIHFVSLNRSNKGTWLAIDGRWLHSADLNGDVCADAFTGGWYGVRAVLGTASGLDVTTQQELALPQAASLSTNDKIYVEAAGFVHDGLHQLVVAGTVFDNDGSAYRSPFMDIFTFEAGRPGTPQVLDMTGLVDPSGWPTEIAADRSVVVVGALDTINGREAAGAVHVLIPNPVEPRLLTHHSVVTQASPGVAGAPETADGFGSAVALRDGYLAIGTPYETTGSARKTGQVQIMRWNAAARTFKAVRAIDQNTAKVTGTNETNDWFGASLAIARGLTASGSYDVVIGAPGENVGKATDAGSVTIANVTKARYRTYTQNSKGVPGTAERQHPDAAWTGEAFGKGLGVLPTSSTTDTLAIGAPGETNGSCLTQGYVILSNGKRLSSSTKWTYLKPPTTGCSGYDSDEFDGWGSSFGN